MTNVSQLEVLITRACNPTMGEPNYALHLEVADYINQKKANTYVRSHPFAAIRDSNLSPLLGYCPHTASTRYAARAKRP